MNENTKKGDTVYIVDAYRTWDVSEKEFLRADGGLAYCRTRGEGGRGSSCFTPHIFNDRKSAHEFSAAFLENAARCHREESRQCSEESIVPETLGESADIHQTDIKGLCLTAVYVLLAEGKITIADVHNAYSRAKEGATSSSQTQNS